LVVFYMQEKSLKEKLSFPTGFLWGTATSAHQVEGSNTLSDWWRWEKSSEDVECSGAACEHYKRFRQDFELLKNTLHNNAHRFSLEWSRIEPKPGIFSRKEITHYRNVLLKLKELRVKTIVTLHHFVNPAWFVDLGGWEKKQNINYFLEYVSRCVSEFGELVDYWVVINEPNIYIQMGYIQGTWPPQEKNLLKALKVYKNMAGAHKKAYKIIHSVFPDAKVSSAIHLIYFRGSGFLKKLLVGPANFVVNDSFMFLTKKYHDYFPINHYVLHDLRLRDLLFVKKGYGIDVKLLEGRGTDVGWPIYPRSIYEIVKLAWDRYRLPLIISENGIADETDKKRPAYIVDYLTWLHQAIKEGAGVLGYFHWTLMDNFEWHLGRSARFGLFRTDYKTQNRVPRKSAYVYAKICQANGISPHILLDDISEFKRRFPRRG
jgi:beta-glucosidase